MRISNGIRRIEDGVLNFSRSAKGKVQGTLKRVSTTIRVELAALSYARNIRLFNEIGKLPTAERQARLHEILEIQSRTKELLAKRGITLDLDSFANNMGSINVETMLDLINEYELDTKET